MYDNWGWGWGGWLLMTLVMIVFWAAVITRRGAGGALCRRFTPPRRRPWTFGASTREDLLAERFARGQIDDDEYRQRLTLLREHR